MGVTTKVKYKTSDNKYYDTEKEAIIVQNTINRSNLIPWREQQYDKWLKSHDEVVTLLDNKSTDGGVISSIVCEAILNDIKSLLELAQTLSHPSDDEEEEEGGE